MVAYNSSHFSKKGSLLITQSTYYGVVITDNKTSCFNKAVSFKWIQANPSLFLLVVTHWDQLVWQSQVVCSCLISCLRFAFYEGAPPLPSGDISRISARFISVNVAQLASIDAQFMCRNPYELWKQAYTGFFPQEVTTMYVLW